MNDCYLSWKYDIRATYVGNQKKEFPSLQRLSIGWVDQFHLTEKCRSTSYQPDMIWTRNQTKSKSELFDGNINYSWTENLKSTSYQELKVNIPAQFSSKRFQTPNKKMMMMVFTFLRRVSYFSFLNLLPGQFLLPKVLVLWWISCLSKCSCCQLGIELLAAAAPSRWASQQSGLALL